MSSLRTDGISCSLLFTTEEARKKKKKQKTEEMYIDEETLENVEGKHFVGIDPNKGNLLYCLDTNNVVLRHTQNSVRKARRKTIHKRIRKEILKTEDENILSLEKQLSLCNSKSSFSHKFITYITVKNKYYNLREEHYRPEIFRKLNFKAWCNNRSLEDNFMNKFKDTYGEPDDVVITIGDWEQRQGISFGKEPTKGVGLRRVMRKAGYKVYLVDERMTSRRCCKCHSGNNEFNFARRIDPRPWMKQKLQKVWGLSRCKNGSCRVVHNRDFNAASNIRDVALAVVGGRPRPEWIQKKKKPKKNTAPVPKDDDSDSSSDEESESE